MIPLSIYTDGSSYPKNPGRGGAGYVLVYNKNDTSVVKSVGYYLGNDITNNYAETQAVIYAVTNLTKPCNIRLYTDSQYVIYGINRINNKHKKLLKTHTYLWGLLEKIMNENKHKISGIKLDAHKESYKNIHSMGNNLADKLAGYSARTGKVIMNTYSSVEEAYRDRPTKQME